MTLRSIPSSLLLMSLATVVLPACSTLDAHSDTAAGVSIAACHTYSWLEAARRERPGAFDNPLNDARLRDAIARRLQNHGMALAQSGPGDCLVGYAIGTRIDYSDYGRSHWSFGLGTGLGWGRHGYGSVLWDTGMPYDYRESRIAVDLFKAGSPGHPVDPIWHASVGTDVTQLTGAEAEKRIDEAVAAIFGKFPVAAH